MLAPTPEQDRRTRDVLARLNASEQRIRAMFAPGDGTLPARPGPMPANGLGAATLDSIVARRMVSEVLTPAQRLAFERMKGHAFAGLEQIPAMGGGVRSRGGGGTVMPLH